MRTQQGHSMHAGGGGGGDGRGFRPSGFSRWPCANVLAVVLEAKRGRVSRVGTPVWSGAPSYMTPRQSTAWTRGLPAPGQREVAQQEHDKVLRHLLLGRDVPVRVVGVRV